VNLEIPGISSKKLLISYAAGAILLWFFLSRTDWSSIISGMRTVAWPLLGFAIVLRFAALILSSLRWRYLLLPVRSVGFASIMIALMMGTTVSLAISGQAAEFVRPLILSRNEDLDFTAAMSTVTVEWLFDALAILTFFIPALVFLRSAVAGMSSGTYATSNLSLALLMLMFLAAVGALSLARRRRINFSCRNLPIPERFQIALARQLQRFDVGLDSLRRPHGFSSLYTYSLGVSLLTALSCWMALEAFGLSLPVTAALIVLGIVTVGGMTPTPGAVGGFHAVCQLSLVTLFRIEPARTVLPVIGMHAVLYLPAAIIGALCAFPYLRSGETEIAS